MKIESYGHRRLEVKMDSMHIYRYCHAWLNANVLFMHGRDVPIHMKKVRIRVGGTIFVNQMCMVSS